MIPDERTLLTRFLDDLVNTRGIAKDQEADALIRQAIAANPDAAYLLVQHAIVTDQSLQRRRPASPKLERQAPPVQRAPSFLPQQGAGPWSGRSATCALTDF